MLSEEKKYAKPNEVNGDGDEDKNYNIMQTDRQECGWGR